ncbi:MAG: ABC transporter substrate-binding protein [Bradyrhizobiaceae bacterium]|nr:MAG: ABC transporter substrate-binding protein [Bradyrhizobiaceae bacterium]
MRSIRIAARLAAALTFLAVVNATCAGAQETVRITNIGHGYYAGPLYVAIREKLFEKHGLKADVTFVKGGALVLQSLLSKDADFGVLTYEHVITAAAQGKSLVQIFNITTRPINNMIASGDLMKADANMSLEQKILSLKGKRVGTPSAGGSGEKMLGVLAKQYGLKLPGDIELVYLGADAPAYVGAFQAKMIDAAIPFEPAGAMLEQKKLGGILINLMNGDVEQFRDLVFMGVVTNPDTIKNRPDLVKKVAAVFSEAQGILLDPARGKKIMAEEFPDMSPETNERSYELLAQIWSKDGRMTLEGAKKVYNFLQPPGDKTIEFEKTFTNEFLPSK